MDVSTLAQLIGSVGFPIAMCLWMAKHMQSMQERHTEEINSLRDIIQENTIALTKLVDRINNGVKFIEE